ncbi:DNA-J related domain-containing protein [Aliikangiella sp. IMCC44653]
MGQLQNYLSNQKALPKPMLTLLSFFELNPQAISEYELMQWLQKKDFYTSLELPLSLFKKHFYLYHYLYQLKIALRPYQLHLMISPLSIQLLPSSSTQSIAQSGAASLHSTNDKYLADADPLQDFYLDPTNLELSDDAVTAMQRQFWEKFLAIDKKAAAIRELELTEVSELNIKILKQQYRRLANLHHPDKGGDANRFAQIENAYQNLKLLLS